MRYSGLSAGNLKKAAKDYTVYFLTLTASSTLFFAFLSLTSRHHEFSGEDGNYSLVMFENIIRYAVWIISVVFLALIRYVNSFMLRQRGREFAVYMILGIEQTTIAKRFFCETFLFGMTAAAVGCLTGTALSGILTAVVRRMMDGAAGMSGAEGAAGAENAAEFSFSFYPDTILTDLLFFAASFLLIGLFNVRRIRKIRLVDLFSEQKRGEGQAVGKRHYAVYFAVCLVAFLFVLFVLISFFRQSGIYAGNISPEISNRYQTAAVLAAAAGIFALYHAASFLLTKIRKGDKWKNRGTNAVLLGNLFQKVSSSAKVLSICTLSITVSCVAFVIFPTLAEISSGYLSYRMPYSIMIDNNYQYIDEMEDIPQIDYSFADEILQKHGVTVKAEVTQESYFVRESDFNTAETRENHRDMPRLAMRLSDYNAMRQMAGMETVTLAEGEFLLHIDYELDPDQVKAAVAAGENGEAGQGTGRNGQNGRIRLDDGTVLTLADDGILNDPLGSYLFNYSSDSVLVFEDSVCDRLHLARTCWYADTDEIPYDLCSEIGAEISQAFRSDYASLYEKYETKYGSDRNYIDFLEPIRFLTQERSDVTMTASSIRLLGIYSGVIFLILCMTVLSLHLITDMSENRHQYRILYRMGVEQREIEKIVRKQTAIYFFVPCLAAFVVSLLLICSFLLRYGYKVTAYVGAEGFRFAVLIPAVLTVILLVCYFSITMAAVSRKLRTALRAERD